MKELIRSNTTLRWLNYRARLLRGVHGQSDESKIITDLANNLGSPKTIVEFGFHPLEFNCASLVRTKGWTGLLIDGSARQVSDAKALLPKHIEIVEAFLTLDNLQLIKSKCEKLGVLSIDVDGNDYWFLEALIGLRPSVICVEYNASFGLEPISVPYDPEFDRHQKHPTGWYHGASLTALAKLCGAHGYGLAAISEAGANAFFTQGGGLVPEVAWRPSRLRYEYSGIDQNGQWDAIRHLSFIRV